jgi:O-acetyl-ADP-ribose deacetylase (regulator of RNase III)
MSEPRRLGFGNTLIDLILVRPLQTSSAGLLVPANTHAVMVAGLAGEVRVRAGRTVEDELNRFRPLDLGRAYPTGAGRLSESGFELLVHAVVSVAPGEPNRTGQDERALVSALDVFEEAGVRSVTLPIVRIADGRTQPAPAQRTMAAALASHLRRGSRIQRLTIAGLDDEHLARLSDELRLAGAIRIEDQAAPG